MSRKTQRELARLVAAEKLVTPGFTPKIELVAVGPNKQLRMVGKVTIGANVYECASDTGGIKTFNDVDDFLKYVAKAAETGDGVYNVEVDTGALLASSVPSNMVTWAQGQITKLGKVKASQNVVVGKLDSQIDLMVGWDVGNAAQRAKLAETQAQRAAVLTDIAAIDAEVARLTVIAAG